MTGTVWGSFPRGIAPPDSPSGWRWWWRAGLPPLGLWVALFFREILGRAMPFVMDLEESDLLQLFWPSRRYFWEALRAGGLPCWGPETWCGYALRADPQSGFAYPVNFVLCSLLPSHVAFLWSLLSGYLVAAFGMLWWARALGLSPQGAGLAGMVFLGGGFLVGHLGHVSILLSASWVPMILGAVERLVRDGRGRWILCGAFATGMSCLGGHPDVASYGLAMAGVYGCWRLRPARQVGRWPAALGLAAMLLCGGGLAAIQWLPALEQVRCSSHANFMSWDEVRRFTNRWQDLWLFLSPYHFGTPAEVAETLRENQGFFIEKCRYVGLAPLGLAAIGIWTGRKRGWPVGMLAALAAAGILLGMTHLRVVRWLWETLPGMKMGRNMGRWILLTELSLALLAGMGLERLSGTAAGRTWARRLILVCGLDLWWFGSRFMSHVSPDMYTQTPEVAALLPSGERFYSLGWRSGFREAAWLARRGTVWLQDLEPFRVQREQLQMYLPLVWGRSTATGLNQLQSLGHQLWEEAVERRSWVMSGVMGTRAWLRDARPPVSVGVAGYEPEALRLLRVVGVRYHLSYWPIRNPALRQVGRVPGRAGMPPLLVYEDPRTLPRVRVATRARAVTSPAEAISALLTPGADPAVTVLIEASPAALTRRAEGPAGGGEATLVSAVRERLEIAVRASGAGWLVVSDTWYPGWDASVDGRPATIWRAYGAFRAVALAPGSHRVVMTYRPRIFRQGALVSGMSLLMVSGVAWWAERRVRRSST